MKTIKGFIHTYFIITDEDNEEINGEKFTIAYCLHHRILTVGIAVCSKKDQFCKKVGRDIASGRMLKNPFIKKRLWRTKRYNAIGGRSLLIRYILNSIPIKSINVQTKLYLQKQKQ